MKTLHVLIFSCALTIAGVGYTLANTLTVNHWLDTAGNLLVSLGTCISGESACIGTEPSSFIMVAPAIPRPTIAITGVTTNTTSATFTLPAGAKTLIGKVEGTGAVTQTQTLYGAYDSTAANGVSLSVVTLSGTTKDVKTGSVQVATDYPYYYVVTTNTTGTGATGELTIENSLTASGSSGGGGAVTNAGTFAVQESGAALTALQLIDNDQTGASVYYRTSAGSTEDEHEVKGTAGRLFSITATSTNAAARYLRCANLTAANTTPGTSTVFLGVTIPGQTTGAGITFSFAGSKGIAFSTALTCWLVTGAADTDVAEVAANEIKVVYAYE
jgi:hypothetical protein